jgi:cyclopropane fatty-acyl-phospholipid synthase-like methyltransferase
MGGALLAGPGGDARWYNLGFWHDTRDYTAACVAMARLHGRTANLLPGQAVLELGCGRGAALSIWRNEFGLKRISALDMRAQCVSSLERHQPAPAEPIVQGRFDRPLPAILARQRYDAVVCIDAAYHATSLPEFAACASSVLRAGGILVFSTLTDTGTGAARWRTRLRDAALRLAGVPAESIMTQPALQSVLQQHGLVEIEIRDIGAHVFAGFHAWVCRRHRELTARQRTSLAWTRIRITAWLCQYVAHHMLLDYVLVSARRTRQRSEQFADHGS